MFNCVQGIIFGAMKVIKRLSSTSYLLEGGILYRKGNWVDSVAKEVPCDERDGRVWHKDVGFLDNYDVSEVVIDPVVEDIPAIRVVLKDSLSGGKVEIVVVEPAVVRKSATSDGLTRKMTDEVLKAILEEYSLGDVGSRALAEKYGLSFALVCRYIRRNGVEVRAKAGRKKLCTG